MIIWSRCPFFYPSFRLKPKITPFIYNYLIVQNTPGLCEGTSFVTKINNHVRSQLNPSDILAKQIPENHVNFNFSFTVCLQNLKYFTGFRSEEAQC